MGGASTPTFLAMLGRTHSPGRRLASSGYEIASSHNHSYLDPSVFVKLSKIFAFLCFLLFSDFRDGSHRDNSGESLETLSAVKSQSWVSFWAINFSIQPWFPGFLFLWGCLFHFRPYFTCGSFLCYSIRRKY